MKEIAIDSIRSKIYTIRGEQVMFDRDLATYYEIKTIRLREQVKRNPNRFPEDFIFQLNDMEVEDLVSQNAIPSKRSLGGNNPFVFTEQGVAALSGIIKTQRAALVSVEIFRAFVQYRRTFHAHAHLLDRIVNLETRQAHQEEKMNILLKAIDISNPIPKKGIFFDGQLFDAYIFATELIKGAKEKIILIDNYIDETTLMMLSKRDADCRAVIYTHKISQQLNLDLTKHNQQYSAIEVMPFKKSHDRFLIIDNQSLYHIGASLKDLGKKWFAFSKIDEFLPELVAKLPMQRNN